ncbi:MAG: hypothetical protein KDK50_02340 [Chlamydiia bacterium]|nr:hypothetical protein [Chlamydiia bacterium]
MNLEMPKKGYAEQITPNQQKSGIDIHHPKHLTWWNALSHLSNAKAYNDERQLFFERNQELSYDQVLEKGEKMAVLKNGFTVELLLALHC